MSPRASRHSARIRVSRDLLWHWRRQVRRGTLRAESAAAFLPVRMANDAAPAASIPSHVGQPPAEARIEIALVNGTTVRVSQDISLPALRRKSACPSLG